MIRTYKDKDTEKVHNGERVSKFAVELQRAAQRKLTILANAQTSQDLNALPGNRFKKLEDSDHYSIRINEQWRVTFEWEAPFADEVLIEDYH